MYGVIHMKKKLKDFLLPLIPALLILVLIMKKPFVRNCDLVDAGYTNRQTAAVYLDQLTDKGVLSKEKVGKENIYKNVKLLEMFDEDL